MQEVDEILKWREEVLRMMEDVEEREDARDGHDECCLRQRQDSTLGVKGLSTCHRRKTAR